VALAFRPTIRLFSSHNDRLPTFKLPHFLRFHQQLSRSSCAFGRLTLPGEERHMNRTELVTAFVAAIVVIALVVIGLTNTGPTHNDTPFVLFTR